MSDQTCDCCEFPIEQMTDATARDDRWLDEPPVRTVALPPDVARLLGRLFGEDSIDTLNDFVTAARAAIGDRSLAVDDLCHTEAETSHCATTASETYYFRCFYDGIVLAGLADEPVAIRTESPTGERIDVVVSPEGTIDTEPPDAAMSIGIAADASVSATAGSTPVEMIYRTVCPYVVAFASREAYERWAESVDAATVGLSLAAGVPIAAALTE